MDREWVARKVRESQERYRRSTINEREKKVNERTRREPTNIRKPNVGGLQSDVRRGYVGRNRASISWHDIPAERIGTFVHAVTQSGAAVMLGRTSDNGALSVTILDGDERIREWPHTVDEFDALVES
jgi:hypothetical protein